MKRKIEIKNLSIVYEKVEQNQGNIITRFLTDKINTNLLLNNVNLTLFEGEYLGLVGESGSGKSLTVKSTLGLLNIEPGIVNGQIYIYDNEKKIVLLDTDEYKKENSFFNHQTYDSNYWVFRNENNYLSIPKNALLDNNSLISKFEDNELKNIPSKNICLSNLPNSNNHFHIKSKIIIPRKSVNNENSILEKLKKYNIPGRLISIILQDPLSFLNPFWSMIRQIKNIQDRNEAEKNKSDLNELLTNIKLNTDSFKNAIPRELSGGQGQRAMILLASLTRPDILIADEPTTGLDVTLKKVIINNFINLKKTIGEKFSMIFISHDINMIRKATDRMMVMYKGEIIENCKSASFINTDNHHPYTSRLIGISKDISRKYKNDNSNNNIIEGCKYYSRCCIENKNKMCKSIMPPPIDIENGDIILSEDPNINWTKCWEFLKKI